MKITTTLLTSTAVTLAVCSAALAHPGTGMIHDSQHLLWTMVGLLAIVAPTCYFSWSSKK